MWMGGGGSTRARPGCQQPNVYPLAGAGAEGAGAGGPPPPPPPKNTLSTMMRTRSPTTRRQHIFFRIFCGGVGARGKRGPVPEETSSILVEGHDDLEPCQCTRTRPLALCPEPVEGLQVTMVDALVAAGAAVVDENQVEAGCARDVQID